MGNKASYLFGGSEEPKNGLLESEERKDCSVSEANPFVKESSAEALSEEQKAEAARYSELFGGKPKVKNKGNQPGSVGERNSTASKASSSRKKSNGRKTKKHCTANGDQDGQGLDGQRGVSTEESGDDAGGHSGPVSPCRKKCAAASTLTEEERKQELVQVVTAKIMDLEKQKEIEGVMEREGHETAAEKDQEALTTIVASDSKNAGKATEAARARAMVTNALYAGADPAKTASKELLESGGFVLDAVAGTGITGGVAAMPAKHISPRPLPQRNFKTKV